MFWRIFLKTPVPQRDIILSSGLEEQKPCHGRRLLAQKGR